MKNKSGMKQEMGDGKGNMSYGGKGRNASTIPEKWPSGGSGMGKQSGRAGSISNSSRSPRSVSRSKG